MLEQLNPSQKKAVTQTEGPVMVLAGAGSGKTKTLVSRITYLLEEKSVSPYQILALTFSNKAAREMRDRIAHTTGLDWGALQVTTFHSFCARVLRSEAEFLGLTKNFTIYDDVESRSVAKAILGQKGISLKEISPYAILQYVNELKNSGYYSTAPSRENDGLEESSVDKDDEYYSYYLEYENELARSNAVDFGGLLVGVLKLFEKFPAVLERYQKRYQYILIDEYQDTNRAQFLLIKLLGELNKNICVVGDEDQSIYSWRGADIRNILDFEKIYPDVSFIKLEQNYRSSKTIIEAASFVIDHNVHRKGKKMWTDNREGEPIVIVECPNERAEAQFLTTKLKNLKEQGSQLKEMAVFYRGNAQSRVLEEELRRENISYRIVGGVKFYERKEIKDIVSYLKLVINPQDSLALSRIINVPARGIGATTLRKLEQEAVRQQISLWEATRFVIEKPQENLHIKLSKKVFSTLKSFVSLIEESRVWNQQQRSPSSIAEKIIHESGYLSSLQIKKDHESLARIENIEEFLNGIKQFELNSLEQSNLSFFIESITLDSGSTEDVDEDQLSLMTVHSSKGLEFEHVFIVGAEENIFPSYQSLESGEEAIEEERRLFYVAMTRAMKKLFISSAQSRMLFGNVKFNGPSRFLAEIPDKYYSKDFFRQKGLTPGQHTFRLEGSYSQAKKSSGFQEKVYMREKPDSRKTFPEGCRVTHSLYGKGKIVENEGFDQDEKVLIRFEGGVKKRFLVKFAPLSRI